MYGLLVAQEENAYFIQTQRLEPALVNYILLHLLTREVIRGKITRIRKKSMLAIRLQRTGRAKHAQYRMVVQDARKSPTSGKIVTSLGSYNPHTKAVTIDKEKAGKFLSNGAQPSSRVVSLLAKEGVAIPDWAKKLVNKERSIKNTDKLRKHRPAEEVAPVEETPVVEEVVDDAETPAVETPESPVVPEAETVVEETAPEA